MEIRLAVISDLETLLVLVVGFREVLGRAYPDEDTLRENLRKLLVDGEAEYFLAFDGRKEAIGYIQQRYRYSIWLSTLEATLEDLYVSPRSRRRGAGTALVQFAIHRARQKGCRSIKLDTNEQNRSAIDLYHKLGFLSGSSRFSGSRQLMLERILESSV